MQRCHPSRIARDSPAFCSNVPRNRDNVPRFRKIRNKKFYLDYFRRKSVLNRSIRLVESHLPDVEKHFPPERNCGQSRYRSLTESFMAAPNFKRRRVKPKRKAKFNENWISEFSCIGKSQFEGNARCTLCACDFTITSGGRVDLKRHIETIRHRKLSKATTAGIGQYIAQGNNNRWCDEGGNKHSVLGTIILSHT